MQTWSNSIKRYISLCMYFIIYNSYIITKYMRVYLIRNTQIMHIRKNVSF